MQRRRSSSCWRKHGAGLRGSANRYGSGYRINRTRSSAGSRRSFQGCHRYCANHFLRDVAQPVLEADSHAKVQMRRTVRGLRAIEQEVLAERRTPEPPPLLAPPGEATSSDAVQVDDASQDVVLDYCAAVRGILNDDQGGPLHPPGLRMAEALADVHASLQRNVEAQKGGRLTSAVPV